MPRNELTAERARELLFYDPGTGVLRWRVPRGGSRADDVAGHLDRQYVRVCIDGRLYVAQGSSGCKGVSWHKRRLKYQINIAFDGKQSYLGLYDTIEEAAACYAEAARKYHSEFARTGGKQTESSVVRIDSEEMWNYWRQCRGERRQPWLTEGISRTTWYRRELMRRTSTQSRAEDEHRRVRHPQPAE